MICWPVQMREDADSGRVVVYEKVVRHMQVLSEDAKQVREVGWQMLTLTQIDLLDPSLTEG